MLHRFQASEFDSESRFSSARMEFEGDEANGWLIRRNGQPHLNLGPGYRFLRVDSCGVCSTDLARAFLPFPLPQITGHEIVARDEDGNRFVVEINASHVARGISTECPFCNSGLERHCPERLVLGIHDLPGGFGPGILAPVKAILPVPSSIPDSTAVLVEPLAAALNAVETIRPKAGETVAVLGPRRLGMLVIAALAAEREASGIPFKILALARHERLRQLAKSLGADASADPGAISPGAEPVADVVIDTTGNPEALDRSIAFAEREVHLKSTHGRASAGQRHLTELVVDELAVERYDPQAVGEGRVAWLCGSTPPDGVRTDVRRGTPAEIAAELRAGSGGTLPRCDVAVVDSAAGLDAAIRPEPDREESLVRPRGRILVHPDAGSELVEEGGLIAAVRRRGLRLTSSRCGDFRQALRLLEASESLRNVGDRFITHRFGNEDMNEVFEIARSSECIKAVVRPTDGTQTVD